ncbi:MAG: transglycosylase SLT domain-containing protein [Pseudomonadota bacterium]
MLVNKPLAKSLVFLGALVLAAFPAGRGAAQEKPPANSTTKPISVPLIREFPLPEQVFLCGEKVPLEDRHTREMLDTELTLVAWGRAQVFLWHKRAARYFPHFERELSRAGLPGDLKYLAMAESDLRPQVMSPAGALGTWQFMPATGQRFGLEKNEDFDHRRNSVHSTRAAIKYLKHLHQLFGKWSLAMAAYNCGEGRVAKEIREQGVRDYFFLDLPTETERYIHRIIAIKTVLENPRKYGFALDPTRTFTSPRVEQIRVDLPRAVHFTKAAQAVGSTYKTLKEMNPEILGRYLPAGEYSILVPAGRGETMSVFLQMEAAAADKENSQKTSTYWVVKPGQSLGFIAARSGCSIRELKKINRISGDKVLIGQKLRLP